MAFPLGLTPKLALALVAQRIGVNRSHPFILTVSLDDNFDSSSFAVDASRETETAGSSQSKAVIARHFRSPIIWIAGAEPLQHPQIARFVTALAGAGRHVFLHTNGVLLPRRIHQFQPSSRLHFTFRFDGHGSSHDTSNARADANAAAVESIRRSKLSGFQVCAQLLLHTHNETGELTRLHDELREHGVDEVLISSATLAAETQRQVAELRQRLLNKRWALLSSFLDAMALPPTSQHARKALRAPLVNSRTGEREQSV